MQRKEGGPGARELLAYEHELRTVNTDLRLLSEKKELLIRKFVRANSDVPADMFFRRLLRVGGLPAALRWYMLAYNVGVLEAKKELDLLVQKR